MLIFCRKKNKYTAVTGNLTFTLRKYENISFWGCFFFLKKCRVSTKYSVHCFVKSGTFIRLRPAWGWIIRILYITVVFSRKDLGSNSNDRMIVKLSKCVFGKDEFLLFSLKRVLLLLNMRTHCGYLVWR